jgi:hypothetical protein
MKRSAARDARNPTISTNREAEDGQYAGDAEMARGSEGVKPGMIPSGSRPRKFEIRMNMKMEKI